MICFLPTKYRNSNHIDNLLSNVFSYDEELPDAMKETKTTRNELAPSGPKPLWISSASIQKEQDNILSHLEEATNGYKDVIWTCAPASDHSRFKDFCGDHWKYVPVDQMDGSEAACVVVFGIPAYDLAQSYAKLGRLFSRARNSVAIITEDEVAR